MLAELNWDVLGVGPNEIGGVVKGGIVTLAGWVDSFTKKWAAEEAAHRVRGVKAVANEIEVRLPAFAERTDADLAAAVRTLQSDTVVPSDKIRVMLRGEVNWQFQKKAAARVVRRLAGVKGVSNLITLRRQAKPSLEELKSKIEEALVRDAETDAHHITVEVQGNKVILSGTVRSGAERAEAERVAGSTPGVTEIIDRLRVS